MLRRAQRRPGGRSERSIRKVGWVLFGGEEG